RCRRIVIESSASGTSLPGIGCQRGKPRRKKYRSYGHIGPIFVCVNLALYRVANVFDCFSNFPSGLAEAFLNIAFGIVGSTLGFEIAIVESPADTFFCFALHLIEFAFNFIPVW